VADRRGKGDRAYELGTWQQLEALIHPLSSSGGGASGPLDDAIAASLRFPEFAFRAASQYLRMKGLGGGASI